MVQRRAASADDAAMLRQTRNLIEYLREFVRTAHKAIRDCRKYEDVVWLHSLPRDVLRRQPSSDRVILTVDHRPRVPAPAIPDELVGWLEPGVVAVPSPDDPDLVTTRALPAGAAAHDHHDGRGPAGERDAPDELVEEQDSEPDLLRNYHRWLPQWRRWSERERAAESYRKLHRRLQRIARRIEQDSDIFEAALGVGLITGGADRVGGSLHRHLLAVPIAVTMDAATMRISVSVVPDWSLRFEDAEFLDEADGYSSELLAPVRNRLEESDCHPLSSECESVLEAWSQRAFGTTVPVRCNGSWDQPTRDRGSGSQSHAGRYEVTLAPAVLLRERGRSSIVSFYDAIAARLARPGAASPLGLAQLLSPLDDTERVAWIATGTAVTPTLGPDPLFPLPVNAAQRDVLERLQRDTGVVVQGPPGTGKTHTIANLVCALLADGKRVLVTSEKDQALRVLRDKLPDDIRGLCVLQGDPRRGGTAELDRSVRTLAQLNAATSPQALAAQASRDATERQELLGHGARLRTALRELRESEWFVHPEVAPGYQGQLRAIIESVQAAQEHYSWLPPLPDDAPDLPRLSTGEARRLLELLQRHGPDLLAQDAPQCPDPDTLPAPSAATRAVAEVAAARAVCGGAGPDTVADALADRGQDFLSQVNACLGEGMQALRRGGLGTQLMAGQGQSWHVAVLLDGMAGRRQQLWLQVAQASVRAEQAQHRLHALETAHVDVPQPEPAALARMIATGRVLADFLREGGKLRRWFAGPAQRDARALLETCRVDGRRPDCAVKVATVVTYLEAQQAVHQANKFWELVGVKPTGPEPALVALADLADRAGNLRTIAAVTSAARDLHDLLVDARIPTAVRSPQEWEDLRSAANRASLRIVLAAAQQTVDELVAALPQFDARRSPELAAAYRALATYDADAYAQAFEALRLAYVRETDRREALKLLEQLAAAHPDLARALVLSPLAPEWPARLAAFQQAWAWRRAADFVDRLLTPGREKQLETELGEVEARLRETVERLASTHARMHCLNRMTAAQKQALSAYITAMNHAGRGTSVHGKRHLRAARSAMREARGAVPAWVMPLKQVAAMIVPEPDSFDVVIIDEASQVGLDGLLLLWLAPRIIVVGDDQQCAPLYMAGDHTRLHRRVDELLPDLDHWQRDGLDPKSSLYTIMSSRFSEVVRLVEHFRCMPEIIQWSSRQFYDHELVPLRQHGADRLHPLRVVHVPDGHCEGGRDRLRNLPEAERIVATLQRLTDDPDYADRSFGVISLRSGAQVRLLEDLIDTTLDAAARERHNIRVGTAAQFQGDERDVVLLSMVVDADHVRAIRSLADGRRFNVAASRARDQMWLFASVTIDQLPDKDLRRSLLTYMQSPPILQQTPPELADVSPDEPRAPFQSLFEQRVFLKIRQRGYHVVPQWKVNRKLIDLVVVGEAGRLAVECDGSPYHSSLQQIHDDFERERELRRAGWRFWRIRSSTFALSADESLEPLWARLDALGIRPGVSRDDTGDLISDWMPVELDSEASDSDTEDLPMDNVALIDGTPFGAARRDLPTQGA
ncbi:AAA domain-containing protein [Embleya sp. NBC_00888]|uniref:AAA domain-containing protein n=1 Tax=Embleya sp. NBC_00888 TaxID=2975960 RepID=UPI00386FC38F|nr:AAA domain-containing protein [Embleya sp. NBC_00888]